MPPKKKRKPVTEDMVLPPHEEPGETSFEKVIHLCELNCGEEYMRKCLYLINKRDLLARKIQESGGCRREMELLK